MRLAHLISIGSCTHQKLLGLVSLARPSDRVCWEATYACEREERLWGYAKALPSEVGGKQPGEARERPTCAWARPVGYPWSYSTWTLAIARTFSREGLQRGLVESESFPIPPHKVVISGVCILYLIYILHYFLHLLSTFTFHRIALCSL